MRGLGYAVGASSAHAGIRKNVSRIQPPEGTPALRGLDEVRQLLTPDHIHPNYIYRLVPSGPSAPAASPAQKVELIDTMGKVVPCRGDRCAGRELIGWSDPLPGCSTGLRVGMIDTGVDHQHPSLPRNLQTGTFLPAGQKPAPDWHGTGVLALLAGNPAGGTPGLIPQAQFFVASVFHDDGSGDFATDTASLLDALEWMRAFGVKIINMSFAGPKDDLVQSMIAAMAREGTIFVAAAGNEGPSAPPSYPSAYKQVIAVTAIGKDLRSYPYANRGDHIDVAAPGVDIWTAVPGMKEGYLSGTSFAAPYVTATLATVYGKVKSHGKESLLAALEARDLGPPGRDAIFGRGLLMAPKDCRREPQTAGGKPPAALQAAPSAPAPAAPVSAPAWYPSVVMTPAAGRSGVGALDAGLR